MPTINGETPEEQIQNLFERKLPKKMDDMTYDDWLEYFRKITTKQIILSKDWLSSKLPVEGFAAVSRWLEIAEDPVKMDKLYQGRLKAKEKDSIMKLAVGEDDEAFYEALIKENVAKLDESRNSAQEVARITQNLNIFRKQLREIRSRKPRKGSVLEKVLELSAEPRKTQKKPASARKTTKKKTATKPKSKKEVK